MAMATTTTMASSSEAMLSQELFDETVLENEECFDLSPDEALRETIDQFRRQLGSCGAGAGVIGVGDGGAAPSPSPTSVARSAAGASSGDAKPEDEPPESTPKAPGRDVPPALAHLVLSHPDSPDGRRARDGRRRFRNSLASLDGFVGTDGKVTLNDADVERALEALGEVGRRCRSGDGDGTNGAADAAGEGGPLPYLAIFQQTSSIYTLMSFLSVVDPASLRSESESSSPQCRILEANARTLSSILGGNPSRDDGRCARLRAECRDAFVPALGRLVGLVGGFGELVSSSSRDRRTGSAASSVLSRLLRLGTNATKGCEGGKVAFVQSTLPSELDALSISACGTKRGGVAAIVRCLTIDGTGSDAEIRMEACQLLASLCRYDDFRDPSAKDGAMGAAGVSASSAHDHALEFHRAGAAKVLIEIARDALSACSDGEGSATEVAGRERLAAAALTGLRVLAVNDEIIQTMVALGALSTVVEALELGASASTGADGSDRVPESPDAGRPKRQRLAAGSLGLARNLCGNDEIKTNLCLGSADRCPPSVLGCLLRAMHIYPSVALVQEHACGTLAAMSLRRPANARAILDAGGPRWVLLAMKRHEDNVNVQRQGALAVRNIASRLLRDLPEGSKIQEDKTSAASDDERSAIRDAFLDQGAEEVLRNIAGRHQGSVDEAYAALRDLGCGVSLVKINTNEFEAGQGQTKAVATGRTMMFGEKHNANFRPVYEESAGLADGVDSAISQFGGDE
ncbi:hypothetical protein ACHAWF_003897 [Thalassiosira exigua]